MESDKEQHPFVQWLGDYEPAYKLRPELRAKLASGATETIKVTVQALDGAEGDQVIDNLRAPSSRFFNQRRVLKYRNVTVSIPLSQLTELANSDGVFAIEEPGEMRPLDEAQGQIVAGNLSGGVPTGPGYLSWLASKGFNSSQFTSFSVNVVIERPGAHADASPQWRPVTAAPGTVPNDRPRLVCRHSGAGIDFSPASGG